MAQNRRNTPKYVYDIPYFERMELCKILDQNDKWEELGGVYMNFDVLTIQTLRREILRGNSPTDELLTKWGHQNHTILELFVLLSKMQHYQAMLVIKQFVDVEYHRLIYEGEQNICRIFKDKQNSKLNASNILNQKNSQSLCQGISNGAECKGNGPNNNYNISANINISKTTNNMPDKIAFIENKVLNNNEKKINNCPVPSPADENASNANDENRNNAQTILMNRPGTEAATEMRDPQPSSKFLKPESTKDKNMSEISSIAESVGILPVITFKELELATNGWDQSTILGKGGFGTVYKGTWKNTSVAIKRTRNSETDGNHSVQIQQILGELKMLNSYRHDNILPLYGFSMDGEDPCLIYQYMPNGSLEDRLLCRQGTKPLSWHQRHNIATGTARGIQFLHTIGEKPLIHGDIKSANILLDLNFEPKIGDFGLAREGPYNHYTHMKVSRVHGTRPYLPDEFLRHKKFSTKVDTHSFGIVLFELATGLRAYDDQRQHRFLKDLIENTSPNQLGSLMDKKCVPDEQQTFSNFVALGKCCVSRKPKDRPEMVLVLQELNAMAVKRDLLAKVQSMIRQNSPTPSTPYEMQMYHDYLSQQKRMSPNCTHANNFRVATRAVSPLQPTLFYPDLNFINNAASLDAQAAFNANLVKNNPFLPFDPSKNVYDHKQIKEVASASNVKNEGPMNPEVKPVSPKMEVTRESTKDHQKKNDKSKAPVISVSPPSASYTSSTSSEDDEDTAPTPSHETHPQEDLDYEFASDIDNFLPLISVLGVKGKTEESKEPKEEAKEISVENQEEERRKASRSGTVDISTSAKGKHLWILSEPS